MSARSLLTEIQRFAVRDNSESIDEITTASAPIENAVLAISNGYSSPVFLEINAVSNAKVVYAKLVAESANRSISKLHLVEYNRDAANAARSVINRSLINFQNT